MRDLGRGLWGHSWLVQNNEGREAVLKAALRAEDFPTDVPLPDGIENACTQCLREQFTLLESAKFPFLPKLEGLAALPDGRRALLLTRYRSLPMTANNMPVEAILERLLKVCRTLEKHGRTHGNLRPSNILWNERNEPVLTDLLTPTANKLRTIVQNFSPERQWDVPPEAHGYPTPVWDTWSICLSLYRSLTASHEHPHGDVPKNGIDKLQLATLKDLTVARLKAEETNVRFIGRVTDKSAAMLNRGLSAQPAPSPPYRFTQVAHLSERLAEIYNLSAPRVESVGKLLFTTPALDNVFTGDGPVKFTVSIGCSSGITSHDDIVCGVQLIDLDGEGNGRVQIENIQYDASTHASGRLRFRFHLPSILPGRYEIRVAFSIKGSGNEPTLAAGTFEMRPQPGYVPPSQPVVAERPLHFPNQEKCPRRPKKSH